MSSTVYDGGVGILDQHLADVSYLINPKEFPGIPLIGGIMEVDFLRRGNRKNKVPLGKLRRRHVETEQQDEMQEIT